MISDPLDEPDAMSPPTRPCGASIGVECVGFEWPTREESGRTDYQGGGYVLCLQKNYAITISCFQTPCWGIINL